MKLNSIFLTSTLVLFSLNTVLGEGNTLAASVSGAVSPPASVTVAPSGESSAKNVAAGNVVPTAAPAAGPSEAKSDVKVAAASTLSTNGAPGGGGATAARPAASAAAIPTDIVYKNDKEVKDSILTVCGALPAASCLNKVKGIYDALSQKTIDSLFPNAGAKGPKDKYLSLKATDDNEAHVAHDLEMTHRFQNCEFNIKKERASKEAKDSFMKVGQVKLQKYPVNISKGKTKAGGSAVVLRFPTSIDGTYFTATIPTP